MSKKTFEVQKGGSPIHVAEHIVKYQKKTTTIKFKLKSFMI